MISSHGNRHQNEDGVREYLLRLVKFVRLYIFRNTFKIKKRHVQECRDNDNFYTTYIYVAKIK